MALLHDHQIGCKRGVQHRARTNAMQRGNDLPFDIAAGGQTEFLAEAHTHCRRDLKHRGNLRVAEIIDNLLDMVALGQRPRRAHRHTLSTRHAGGITLGGGAQAHGRVRATPAKLKRIDSLCIAAHRHTAHAADAA